MSIFADQVGQMLCAFGGDLQTAIRAKADIFEVDKTYNDVFPDNLGIDHVFGVQTLGWAYDKTKQKLKAKSASSSMTDLEKRQLLLLDYPASKQFLIRVMGALREEISGRSVPHPREFAIKEEAIVADGSKAVAAWKKVISAILPSIIQNLPAEEYKVVRSNEHTKAVVERVQGIVAGAIALQPSFEDLRDLLKPT